MNDKYDIFISYRRKGGDKYARTIQQALAKDYNVFLDFDELEDGKFDQRIIDAINSSSVFLLILSKGALDRCVNEDDWVRQEILQAVESECHIVPVTIIGDGFEGVPDCLPEDLRNAVGSHQFSEVHMETLFKESLAKLIKKRIVPFVQKEDTKTGAEIHIETDADCDLYRFKTFVAHIKADEDNVIYLSPGKYKLGFVSTQMPDIKCSKVYSLASDVTCDFIEVKIKEEVDRLKLQVKEWYKKGNDFFYECDYKNAVEWYTKAAEHGSVDAQYCLGECYLCYIVVQDRKKGVAWLSKAAEQGHIKAQSRLGFCYYYGKGVEQNYEKAVEWYTKAAKQGDYSDAQYWLGECYYYGHGVAKDRKKTVEWYTKAAKQGHIDAQLSLGNCYYYGHGVYQDYKKAIEWYTKAAEQGYHVAQLCLGKCYYYGKGVKQNYGKAIEWYTKANQGGYSRAQYWLGDCYYYGHGVEQSYEKAVEWYTKAAEHGDADAQYSLGYCYLYGQGVEQNYEKAVGWYTKAAEQGDEDAIEALKELKNK